MHIETDASTLAGELRIVVGQLIRRLRAERRNELSLPQVNVLGHLDRGGPRGISELAGLERVRPQSMASTVAALEDAALVTRRPDPHDGRRVAIELTDAGRAAIAADRRVRESWLAEALERDLSDEERRLVADALAVIARIAER